MSNLKVQAPPGRELLLYVHIPFCSSLCHFCGFYRTLAPEQDAIDRYLAAIKNEMELYAQMPYIRSLSLRSIYFGGGSPSVLNPGQIDDLLKWTKRCFRPVSGTEWTFEGEARTIKDMKRLNIIRENGCSRISFGVQSFHEDVRKKAGIAATMHDVRECIGNLREMGYDINIDLMYGLPGQTLSVWKEDLATAVDIGAVHVDIYDTIFYPNTKMFRHSAKYLDEIPGERERLEMFDHALSWLASSGYRQETIEDFALKGSGYHMKRMLYGGNDGHAEMLGIGASSIGFLNKQAYRNFSVLEDYIDPLRSNVLPLRMVHKTTDSEMGVRMLVYLPRLLKIIKGNVGSEVLKLFCDTIEWMKEKGLIEENDVYLSLTRKGCLWADNIAMEFMDERQRKKMWQLLY